MEFIKTPRTDLQRDIFARNLAVFGKERSDLTPLQLFENDLEKTFVISVNNFKIGLEDYKELIYNVARPAYVMLNQTNDIYINNPNRQEQK